MKLLSFLTLSVLLFSCASNAKKDAEAVCDCLHKNMSGGSVAEQSKCLELQRQSGEKYLKKPDEMKIFNETLTPCLMEMLEKK